MRKRQHRGRGLLNKVIDNLPIELHLPTYRYCGPGTRLQERLARGDKGINPLDEACKRHDIAYSSRDSNTRTRADKILAEEAWKRVKAKDSTLGEKAAAWAVTNAMKLKTKFGGGACFRGVIKKIKRHVRKGDSLAQNVKNALIVAKRLIKKGDSKVPRIIPIPKTGGILPLIPIFAALGALGSLASGTAGIVKAVNDAKIARQKLEEEKRHNISMEGKQVGSGLYLKPYKKGYGLYLRPWKGEGLKKKKKFRRL